MSSKHKKAIRVTIIVALLMLLPLGYLGYLYKQDLTGEFGDLGSVPEFYLNFANRSGGFTHFDTQRQITVAAILGQACTIDCKNQTEAMADLYRWVQENLTEKHHDVPTPLPIRFVTMAEALPTEIPEGWDAVHVEDIKQYLMPEETLAAPSFVVIDDAGRYRAQLNMTEPLTQEKMHRLLTKINSHQFLIHYLVKQTLMWEKAKKGQLQ